MTQQFTTAFAYAKQFSDGAFKAQSLALESFEKVAGLQFDAFEKHAQRSADFLAEAMEVRDLGALRVLWEKGASLGRDNAERAVSVGQEIFAVTQRAAESIGAIMQEQQQAANDAVTAPAASARKAAKSR